MSPSPKFDANTFDKRLPSLGSVDSKPNSLYGGDQKEDECAEPLSNLKSIAEISSDQKSSLSMMGVKVEIVNDKEICAEAETSSSEESDEESRKFEYGRAMQTNESFRAFVTSQINAELTRSGPKIFAKLMKENEGLVEDYLY